MNRRHIDAEWLSVDSAAQVVDASAHTIRRWIKRGQLPASKLICGTWRIKREHLDAFMQGESAAGEIVKTGASENVSNPA